MESEASRSPYQFNTDPAALGKAGSGVPAVIIFYFTLVTIIVALGLLGPWAAGMAYEWNGWFVVALTAFNALVLSAIAGFIIGSRPCLESTQNGSVPSLPCC